MRQQLLSNKLKYEGRSNFTKEGYKVILLEYKGYDKCIIKLYTDTKEEEFLILEKSLKTFEKGKIKNPFHKSVFGIGYVGLGKYKPSINNKDTKEYSVWNGMLRRCYTVYKSSNSYKDVTVCEEWYNFQNFAQWMEQNYNPETMEGWHLDKDIICPNCRVYSPDTCAFVPIEINQLIKGSVGVKLSRNNNYRAYISINNKQKHLGVFKTIEEASYAYKEAKFNYVQYKLSSYMNIIDERAVKTLLNREYEKRENI